jgi:CRISPR system Cascade subunit CasD
MPNLKLLIIRLEGPMQSWGIRARWDVRDTTDEPTKSGIIGLIGCSLGYPMRDERLANELDASIKMGVRVEHPGLCDRDFHTITGFLPAADGSIRHNKDDKNKPYTEISERYYLQDAAFLVVLEAPDKLLEKIKDALLDPRWPIYLGRKSCIPTRPVFEAITTEYTSIDDALQKHPWSAATVEILGKTPEGPLQCIVEDEKGTYERNDRMLVNPARMYGTRSVYIINVKPPIAREGVNVPQ